MASLTVHTKLLDQTLEGARIIDMGSTKTCQCFVLPREEVTEVGKKYPSLKQYAFYLLLGKDKVGKPMAYIGQPNDFTNRVIDHKAKKDFWDKALVFVSKADEIYSSEVQYLEYLGWRKAKDANNYIIENTKDILEPGLSPDKKNDMELFFDEIQFLTQFYGCDVFDTTKAKHTEMPNYEEFYLKMPKKGIDAVVMYYPDTQTFILKKGSMIAKNVGPSGSPAANKFREMLMQDSSLWKDNGDTIIMLSNQDITSAKHKPSGPADVITGTSMQGTTCFVDKNGKSFGDRYPNK